MKVTDDDFANFNNPKENTKVEDDEIKDHLEMLAKKKKQAEVEQFMLAIDRMKQGEKGLYTRLNQKKITFGFRPQSSAVAFLCAKLGFVIFFKFLDP